MSEQILKFNALSEADCWRIFSARDRRYDSVFVTGVQTTGIYCRPSCSARLPKRENVQFFADCAAAEAAGYRPCKRCRPTERDADVEMVERVCRYIDAHYDESLTLADLSAGVHLSTAQLSRVFKRVLGITPRQYLSARRVDSLGDQLKTSDNVAQAIYKAGYGSSSRVYEEMPLGMTPAAYQRGGAGMHIDYAIVDSPLGRLLVGATERGVCAVSLGDSDSKLHDFLHETYPAAEIHCAEDGLGAYLRAVLDYLDGEPALDLPVDIRVTAFQQRVLAALRQIPYGETRSYSEVAEAIGQPEAVRAVARACATNPTALVIPCHRVTRKDGSLSGYRWGPKRKAALLAMEKAEDENRQPVA